MPKFKPGQSGNPNGAPKREWTWSGVLEKAVEEATTNGGQIKELVAKSLVKESLSGNVVAIKELMNRMDGMPDQNGDLKVEGNYNIDLDGIIGRPKTIPETTDSDSDPA